MRWRHAAVAAFAGAAVGALPALSPTRADLDLMAAVSAWLPSTTRREPPVALALIDAHAEGHPAFAAAPRAYWSAPLARVVDAVLDAGAAFVAVDVILPRDEHIDPSWLRALRRGGREGRIALGLSPGDLRLAPSPSQIAAAGGSSALASVNLHPDADRAVRAVHARDGPLPALAAAAARRVGADPVAPAYLIPTHAGKLRAWSVAALLDCPDNPAVRDAFAGRAVLLGAWLPHEDRHVARLPRAPASLRALAVHHCDGTVVHAITDPAPGVLLHALAAAQWLGDGLRVPSDQRALAVTSGAAVGGALLAATGRSVLLLVVTCVAGVCSVVAFRAGFLVPWTGAAGAALTAAVTAVAHARLDAAWRFAAALPGRFRAAPDSGEVTTLTACFVDIESFTATTEALRNPDTLADELGACLQRLGEIADRHGGFVDKYLGDGLLALFGLDAPDRGPRDAVAAVGEWVAACGGAAPLRLGGRPLRLRIGIATGPARVGALGHAARVHFTAVGDTVNVAARLEQLNKPLGTTVLADAATASGSGHTGWLDCGLRRLRGRRGRVRVFALNVRCPPL